KDRRIRSLTNEDMQSFISQLAMKYSPKTVKNIYGLLTASISMYDSMIHFVVTLPPRPASRPQAPDVKEIQTLYNAAGPKMKMYIYLAMCGLRRGEICAIKYEDIKDGVLHIHADMVLNKDNKFVYKEIPKTAGSDRYITLPGKLLEQIGEGEGFVVKCNPSTLSNDFRRFKHRFGITLRLHDMRHYFASAAVALGIPDIYTADMGGWSRSGTSSVMKEVYQNNIKDMSEHYQKLINEHIEKIVEG
ncbi:MAG: site-specific integrase, partial [Lachnospiraceae bacterium]|nr:site-specific integrase [Lachnospiraceae bacterium]